MAFKPTKAERSRQFVYGEFQRLSASWHSFQRLTGFKADHALCTWYLLALQLVLDGRFIIVTRSTNCDDNTIIMGSANLSMPSSVHYTTPALFFGHFLLVIIFLFANIMLP